MLRWLRELDPADATPDADGPLVLSAGQRRLSNANQILRDRVADTPHHKHVPVRLSAAPPDAQLDLVAATVHVC